MPDVFHDVILDEDPLERSFAALLVIVFSARPVQMVLLFAAGVAVGAML